MFTGIIRNVGTVKDIKHERDGAAILTIASSLSGDLTEGDSIAVNGVCLTVLSSDNNTWTCRLMDETYRRTNFSDVQEGDHVNLERPLTMNQPIDGHFVQGHVEGVCTITSIEPTGDDHIFTFEMPDRLVPYLITKGSVALDGVSLTVVDIENNHFTVSMMPHTLEHTTFGSRCVGDRVNMEVDMIGKYVRSFLTQFKSTPRKEAGLPIRGQNSSHFAKASRDRKFKTTLRR